MVICPLTGTLIPRENFSKKSLPDLGPVLLDYINAPGGLQLETPLCVQDPFDLTHNVTRGLKKIALERYPRIFEKLLFEELLRRNILKAILLILI